MHLWQNNKGVSSASNVLEKKKAIGLLIDIEVSSQVFSILYCETHKTVNTKTELFLKLQRRDATADNKSDQR